MASPSSLYATAQLLEGTSSVQKWNINIWPSRHYYQRRNGVGRVENEWHSCFKGWGEATFFLTNIFLYSSSFRKGKFIFHIYRLNERFSCSTLLYSSWLIFIICNFGPDGLGWGVHITNPETKVKGYINKVPNLWSTR